MADHAFCGFFLSPVYLSGLLAFHNSVARYFRAHGPRFSASRWGKTHAIHQSPHIGSVLQTLLAAGVVFIFAVAGGDPVLTLFSWLTNVGTLGVIVLMALVSFAVPAFFLKNPRLAYGKLRLVWHRSLPALPLSSSRSSRSSTSMC